MTDDWNILTVTRGGTVSLLTGLSEATARETAQRLERSRMIGSAPWTNEYIAELLAINAWYRLNGSRTVPLSARLSRDGDIDRIDVWGPAGAKMDVWPKPDDYDARAETLKALAERVTDKAWLDHFRAWGRPTSAWLSVMDFPGGGQ